MTTETYLVAGLTCGHCVAAVSDEIEAIAGVTDVTVDLVAEGISTVRVTSEAAIPEARVAAALDEAGDYRLADA